MIFLSVFLSLYAFSFLSVCIFHTFSVCFYNKQNAGREYIEWNERMHSQIYKYIQTEKYQSAY